jgi:hypothetical protein
MEVEFQEHFDPDNKTEVELQELIASKRKNGSNKTTRIKLLNELQAQAVPIVLDFMYYTSETNQRMSAERSANVFKIAEGLQVRALQTAIGDFFAMNISEKNMNEFLKAATNAQADMLLAICKAKIRQMIDDQPEIKKMVQKRFLADFDSSGRLTQNNSVPTQKQYVSRRHEDDIPPTLPTRSDIDVFPQ